MDIIALFCDIDYFLFLRDKEIVAYSEGEFGGLEFAHLQAQKR